MDEQSQRAVAGLEVRWTTFYLQVENIRASVARAEALGGKVLMPIMKIPEGEIAVVADPEGHPVGFATGA